MMLQEKDQWDCGCGVHNVVNKDQCVLCGQYRPEKEKDMYQTPDDTATPEAQAKFKEDAGMTNPLIFLVQEDGALILTLAADGVTERHPLTTNQAAQMLDQLSTYAAKVLRQTGEQPDE